MKNLLSFLRGLAAFGSFVLLTTVARAQVPQLIHYQGRVVVGGVPFNGAGQFKFALVNAGAGTTYWSNDGTGAAGSQPVAAVALSVDKGVYSVLLGDTALPHMTTVPATVFANGDVRLRVWFNDGSHGFELLTPDQRLAAVGYALVAKGLEDSPTFSGNGLFQSANPFGTSLSIQNTSTDGRRWSVTSTGPSNDELPGGLMFRDESVGKTRQVLDATGSMILDWAEENDGVLEPGLIFGRLSGEGIASRRTDGIGQRGLHFYTAFERRLTIASDGKVGIGSADPAEMLDVNGTVKATAFKGDGSQLTGIPTPPPGMVLIRAGTFMMGNSVGDGDLVGADPVSATVSSFYMDVNEVTWSQWRSVSLWASGHGYGFAHAGAGKGANHPVQNVDWFDCIKWCNARSEKAGKTPVYYSNAGFTTVYRTGESPVYPNWAAKGYRLPTEAEREYAGRGGLSGQRFPWGNVIEESLANYTGDTSTSYDLGPNGNNPIGSLGGTTPATSPVGSFASDGYGLNDMAGNVAEWCWDWYGMTYAGGIDPRGPASGLTRCLRGGSWSFNARLSRSAYRDLSNPGLIYDDVGFRAVLPSGAP